MNKTKLIVLIVAAVVLVILVFFGLRSSTPTGPGGEVLPSEESPEVTNVISEEIVPGASPVTEEGEVVTPEGKPVELDAPPGSPDAPQQTGPLSEAPEKSVKLDVSAEGFSPQEITVSSGDAVTLSVTSADTQTHVFKFRDESLRGVALGLSPGETRAIVFNAPEKGEYEFYCDVPGHDTRGEVGKMIVK